MDKKTARYLTKSLISRLVDAGNDQWQLQGTVTSLELQALKLLVEESESNPDMDECKKSKQPVSVHFDASGSNHVDVPESSVDKPLSKIEQDALLVTELSSLLLPGSRENIRNVLLRALGKRTTVGQLIDTSNQELLAKPGLGTLKLTMARDLQREILDGKYCSASNPNGNHQRGSHPIHERQKGRNIEMHKSSSQEKNTTNPSHTDLFSTKLSEYVLPKTWDRIKELLLRELGDNATLADLIKASSKELKSIPTVGEKKLADMRVLQQNILDGKYRSTSNPSVKHHRANSVVHKSQNGRNIEAHESSQGEITRDSDHAAIFSTKLREYVLPSTLDDIRDLLLRELGDNATLAHLIKTSSKELKSIPKVGERKLTTIRILQQNIIDGRYGRKANPNGIHQRVSHPLHETQDARNIKTLGDNNSQWQLIETSSPKIQKTPGLGKKALATASTLQQDIHGIKNRPISNPDDKTTSQRQFGGPSPGEKKLKALHRDVLDGKYHATSKSGDQTSGQRRFDGLEDVPMDELELVLLEDVEQFINQLDQISRYIFASRIGWKTPLLTLEEIGKTLQGGSRERIRQIQKQLSNDLVDSLSVSPKTLWINLKSSMSLRGAPLFPRIRNCFTQEKDFYHFLENCCNGTDCKIISITKPSIGNAILDDFWAESISPVHFSKLVDYLQSEHGYEHAVAENALIRLQERGVLDIRGEQIAPRQLSKPLAVAHLLLHSPESMFWKAIHEKVNHLGISKTPFSLERRDSVLDSAVVYGWFYQSGQGEYLSLSHLNLSEQEIEATLFSLKKCLEEAKRGGRDTINLAMDFYGQQPQSLDYFIVRYIACAYGEREGIFFSSKSGGDTVSLDTKFTLATQEEIILKAFVKAGGTLTKHEIAITIRSHSAIHAGYYLDRLIKAEKVVRVSAVEYALSAKAFNSFNIPENINIPRIVKSAATFLAEDPRPVEGEVLQRHLNREFDLENNKYLYLSLLRIHAGRLGYNLYYSHNLVSRFPVKFSNVTELYRQVPERCIQ